MTDDVSLRVLLVGQGVSGGGAETRFRVLAQQLFAGEVDAAAMQMRAVGVSSNVKNLGWRGRLSYVRVILKLRRLINNGEYDVVMSFGMFPNIISAIAIRLCRQQPRLIMNEISQPHQQTRTEGWLRRIIYLRLQAIFYPFSDLLTANSIDGLAQACALAQRAIEQGRRTPNVMSLHELQARANDSASAVPAGRYFICVSRLDYMKRIDTVIDAWRLLERDVDVQLLIVGDGQVRHLLEKQVMALGLNSKITFLGAIDNPMPLLKNATGFILASEYEGFSNSVLEAMCLDVPVITSFCSTDAEEMCEQGAALGFEVGDAPELAEQVRSLATSMEVARSLVRQAECYRMPHLVPEAVHAYETLILECAAAARVVGGKRNVRTDRGSE